MLTFERKVSEEHFVHHDSNCPDVYLVAVYAFAEDFGCHIGGGSAKGVYIVVILPAEAQVAYLGDIAVGLILFGVSEEEYVFSLDVPVDEVFGVYVS